MKLLQKHLEKYDKRLSHRTAVLGESPVQYYHDLVWDTFVTHVYYPAREKVSLGLAEMISDQVYSVQAAARRRYYEINRKQ